MTLYVLHDDAGTIVMVVEPEIMAPGAEHPFGAVESGQHVTAIDDDRRPPAVELLDLLEHYRVDREARALVAR